MCIVCSCIFIYILSILSYMIPVLLPMSLSVSVPFPPRLHRPGVHTLAQSLSLIYICSFILSFYSFIHPSNLFVRFILLFFHLFFLSFSFFFHLIERQFITFHLSWCHFISSNLTTFSLHITLFFTVFYLFRFYSSSCESLCCFPFGPPGLLFSSPKTVNHNEL